MGVFKLQEKTKEAFTKNSLQDFIKEYKACLSKHPFNKDNLDAKSTYNFINELKRKYFEIGPYKSFSIFEISNRLFSDLVLLDGAMKLFENKNYHKIKLNLSNNRGSDIIINPGTESEIYGEACNVAPSFFKEKIRQMTDKLKTYSKAIILYNSDAINDSNKIYLENKKIENKQKIEFIECDLAQWKKF